MVVRCAVAIEYFAMREVSDQPDHPQLTEQLWLESKETRKDILQSVVSEIIQIYVDINIHFTNEAEEVEDVVDDKVQFYAIQILSYGLLYMEFSDGLRILRCWCYLMLIFKSAQRTNYSAEALNLLAQYHFFLNQSIISLSLKFSWRFCL